MKWFLYDLNSTQKGPKIIALFYIFFLYFYQKQFVLNNLIRNLRRTTRFVKSYVLDEDRGKMVLSWFYLLLYLIALIGLLSSIDKFCQLASCSYIQYQLEFFRFHVQTCYVLSIGVCYVTSAIYKPWHFAVTGVSLKYALKLY
mgnify:CR=1 FL=1